MGQWVGGLIVLPSDGPIVFLIDWEYFGKTVGYGLGVRAYQTVNKELDLIVSCKKIMNNNNNLKYVISKGNFAGNCEKNGILFSK